MSVENCIDYMEIPVTDLGKVRNFFVALFGWDFQEWGADYFSFSDGRLAGGLRRSDKPAPASGVLLVFYSENLERDIQRITDLGGSISEATYDFPGGRRFHFVDPTGNEYAMWATPATE